MSAETESLTNWARKSPGIPGLFSRETGHCPNGGTACVAHSLLHHNGPPLTDLKPVMMDPRKLAALGEETRGHPPKQIRKICRSLRAFGFVYPVLVDDNSRVIGGSALVVAVRISHKRDGGGRVGAPLARYHVRTSMVSTPHAIRPPVCPLLEFGFGSTVRNLRSPSPPLPRISYGSRRPLPNRDKAGNGAVCRKC
jgi:hypothetical protein